MTTGWATALAILLILLSGTTNANQIYINQIGDNPNITISQTGKDNAGGIAIAGDDNVISQQQTGLHNSIGPISNGVVMGDRNTLAWEQDGQYHQFEGDLTGSDNTLDSYQAGNGESNYTRVTVNGETNDLTVWQGKRQNGSTDDIEGGDHDAYWTIIGNNNVAGSYQTDNAVDCCASAHHTANIIVGDLNNVVVRQQSNGAHMGFVEVQGDNNYVDLTQTGNGSKFADIVLTGDGHSTTNFQGGGGAHSLELNLYNGGGAYNVNTDQTSMTNQSYSLSGVCTNTTGCAVSVIQY